MLAAELWKANSDLAQACLVHPFVGGLADGTLDPEAFKRYVAQDAFYLQAFAKAYAVAAAKVRRQSHMKQFYALLGGCFEEIELHEGRADKMGIELANVAPYPETTAYVDFLLQLAWHRDVGEIVAGMVPCMRLYAFLGERLRQSVRPGPEHPYGEWIRTYADPGFQALANTIETLLDDLAGDTPRIRAAYRYAMRCELNFFGAPLESPPQHGGRNPEGEP